MTSASQAVTGDFSFPIPHKVKSVGSLSNLSQEGIEWTSKWILLGLGIVPRF